MRFLDMLLRDQGGWRLNVEHRRSKKDLERWVVLRGVLDHANTKRILFDSRQAALFNDIGDAPPKPDLVYPPFDTFYLEFTEPIALALQEPGQYDYARALLFTTQTGMRIPVGDGHEVGMAQCTMFLIGKDDSLVDRSWKMIPRSDMAFVMVIDALSQPDPSKLSPGVAENLGSYLIAGYGGSTRHVGWWENVVMSYNSLLLWIWAYTMAKGVKIVPEAISRQQRRWMERKHIIPKPWHIVVVEPKLTPEQHREEPAYHQSYRYDVIGHLRFNKHRIKVDDDWSYRDAIEWVPPHQRGLDNLLYIPKTYRVEGGKQIARDAMKQYWKG